LGSVTRARLFFFHNNSTVLFSSSPTTFFFQNKKQKRKKKKERGFREASRPRPKEGPRDGRKNRPLSLGTSGWKPSRERMEKERNTDSRREVFVSNDLILSSIVFNLLRATRARCDLLRFVLRHHLLHQKTRPGCQ